MGRKKTANPNLPPRMIAMRKPSGKVYYYYDTGGKPRYVSLGAHYVDAVRKWADLEQGNAKHQAGHLLNFGAVVNRYRVEVIPTKAPRTQKDNEAELAKLLEFFGDGPLSEIKPLHIRQYREWRTAKVRCNRELALFSHIWNMAREWGATDLPNPCAGVKRNPTKGRDVYISDADYTAILAKAAPTLADAMELSYLTGQRPADVLKLRETDIRDGCIELRQGKTGRPLRIVITPALQAIIDRCKGRKRGDVYNTALVTGDQGKPISVQWLSQLWRRAKKEAGILNDLQFRDLRAKAASDKEEDGDIRDAQQLLGHSTVTMTEHYSRKRRGKKIEPVK